MRFNFWLYGAITIAVVYLVACSRFPDRPDAPSACTIGYVYDGDTVELKCGESSRAARITGYDTPETRDASCDAELAHGKKATQRLRQLLKGADVTYQQVGIDKYNRPLINLWADGVAVGEVLVREKLAVPYDGGKRIKWCDRL